MNVRAVSSSAANEHICVREQTGGSISKDPVVFPTKRSGQPNDVHKVVDVHDLMLALIWNLSTSRGRPDCSNISPSQILLPASS
jgi:hypothetical protein